MGCNNTIECKDRPTAASGLPPRDADRKKSIAERPLCRNCESRSRSMAMVCIVRYVTSPISTLENCEHPAPDAVGDSSNWLDVKRAEHSGGWRGFRPSRGGRRPDLFCVRATEGSRGCLIVGTILFTLRADRKTSARGVLGAVGTVSQFTRGEAVSENEVEYTEVLERHNAILGALAQPGSQVVLVTTGYSGRLSHRGLTKRN